MDDQLFTDSIYPPAMVAGINAALAKRAPAVDTWLEIEAITLEHTGHRRMDTAPHEAVLWLIIEDLKLEGWIDLAKAWGWRHYGKR